MLIRPAYDMFSWYKYLIFNLVFSHLSFWSGNLFLIAPFPDHCLSMEPSVCDSVVSVVTHISALIYTTNVCFTVVVT